MAAHILVNPILQPMLHGLSGSQQLRASSSAPLLSNTRDSRGMPNDSEPPPFVYGVAQGRTQLVHVELYVDHGGVLRPVNLSGGIFKARSMTRRQLVDEINRTGALLSARDACKVDPLLSSRREPALFVRPGAVLISLGLQRMGAIVLRDRLYLLAPSVEDPLLCTTKDAFFRLREESNLEIVAPPAQLGSEPPSPTGRRSGAQPSSASFVLVAMEAIFMGACFELHKRTSALAAHVREELDELTSHGGIKLSVGTDWLVIVRELRQRVEHLQAQARSLDDAISCALEDDETIRGFNLDAETDSRSRPELDPDSRSRPYLATDVADAAEQLLEAYLAHVHTASASLATAAFNIAGQEKIALLMLDQVRNRLLKVDVAAASISAATGLGACIASVFGMNTPISFLANVPEKGSPESKFDTWLFISVAGFIATMVSTFIICVIVFLRGPAHHIHSAPHIKVSSVSDEPLNLPTHRRRKSDRYLDRYTDLSSHDQWGTAQGADAGSLRWPSFSVLPRPSKLPYPDADANTVVTPIGAACNTVAPPTAVVRGRAPTSSLIN